jgi:hypothetical protein
MLLDGHAMEQLQSDGNVQDHIYHRRRDRGHCQAVRDQKVLVRPGALLNAFSRHVLQNGQPHNDVKLLAIRPVLGEGAGNKPEPRPLDGLIEQRIHAHPMGTPVPRAPEEPVVEAANVKHPGTLGDPGDCLGNSPALEQPIDAIHRMSVRPRAIAGIANCETQGKNRKVLSVSDDPEAAQEPLTSRDPELRES